MRFEFATATRIIFGPGTLREVGPLAREFGPRALVVTGADPRRAEPLLALLREQGLGSTPSRFAASRRSRPCGKASRWRSRRSCGLVIAFGGGSALDAGKAIAAMLTNAGELLDYLEVIGRGKALTRPSAPFHRHPDHRGHRLRSHPQRRARLAGASRQSQPAQPAHAAEGGGR